jgi:hypothetical protein
MAPFKLSISQKILNATASLSKGTTKHVSRRKVAQLCGQAKSESRSYVNQIGILKNKKGFIVVVDADTIYLTEKGLKNAEAVPPEANNEDALEAAKAKIKMGKGKKAFAFLSDGETRSYSEIGTAIGNDPAQRSFQNIIGPLKTLGYIEYTEKDGEKACRMVDEMFPFGRPNENDITDE